MKRHMRWSRVVAFTFAACVVVAAASCGNPTRPGLPDGATNDGGATSSGPLELLAGDIGGPGDADGVGTDARFRSPFGVADTVNLTLRKVTAAGVVTTLAGASRMPGDADGIGADARFVSPFGVVLDGAGDACTGTAARFGSPSGVGVDSAGNVYVADRSNVSASMGSPVRAAATRRHRDGWSRGEGRSGR